VGHGRAFAADPLFHGRHLHLLCLRGHLGIHHDFHRGWKSHLARLDTHLVLHHEWKSRRGRVLYRRHHRGLRHGHAVERTSEWLSEAFVSLL